MRFWIRYPLQDADDGQGGGGAAAAVAETADPGQAGDAGAKAQEPSAREKKMAALRESIEKGEGVPKPESGDKPQDEGKSPGPVRTPKPAEKPAADKKDEPAAAKEAKQDGSRTETAAETADDGGDEPPKTVKLSLPGRQIGSQDVEFELPRKALEEAGVDVDEFDARVQQMRRGYIRGNEILPAKRELAAQRAELDEIESSMKQDPVGFLTDRIEKPELQEKIVERLLPMLPDEAFDRVLRVADELSRDPTKRENARLRAEVEDRRRREDHADRTRERKADLDTARKIGEAIADVMAETELGDDLEDARSERFFDHAIQQIARHAHKNEITELDPSTVPALLEELGVLEDFGLTRGKRGGKPKAAGEGDSQPAAEGKQDPRERDKRRREATTTPSGDGAAAAAGDRPPKGQTFRERIKWLREKVSS